MSRPRRRKKSAGARLRPFWIPFVLVAIAAGAGGYYAARWKGFYPHGIAVSGNRVVPASEILARAGIAARENLWLQNMGAAQERVESIPYVKTARIHRGLPASVRIEVTERRPFAVLQIGARRVMVDRELRVLQPAGTGGSLPVLELEHGTIPPDGNYVKIAHAQRLLADYEALSRAHVATRALRYDKFGDLIATTVGGIALLLGDDGDLSKKTPLIDPIISQVSATGKRLAAVDLRAPRTPVVVYKK